MEAAHHPAGHDGVYNYPSQPRLDPRGESVSTPPPATPEDVRRLLAEADRLDQLAAAAGMPWDRVPRRRAGWVVWATVLVGFLAPVLPSVAIDDVLATWYFPAMVMVFPMLVAADTGPRVAVPGRSRPLDAVALAVTALVAIAFAALALVGPGADMAPQDGDSARWRRLRRVVAVALRIPSAA
ncbi:hypothetical protein ACQP1U_15110 [Actinomycetota bacterium]